MTEPTTPENPAPRKPSTRIPMLKSGHCEHPSAPEHPGCRLETCACTDCEHGGRREA